MARLAVLSPSIGTVSETFVLRHMRDLLPDNTVVIADTATGEHLASGCPRLLLGKTRHHHVWPLSNWRFDARARAQRAARVLAFLREHQVDVAMSEFLSWSHEWLPVTRDAGIRFFAHAHGYDVSRKLRFEEWRSRYLDYNLAAGVIVVSEASRRRLIELGITADKVHVVPCGVDVPAMPPAHPVRDTVRCLAVGRMVPKKAPHLTLEAFRLAAERRNGLYLDFIGDGELWPVAEQYVRDFNLGGRVRLHGPQSHAFVQQAMRDADIFLQHSLTDPATGDEEGLPVAILEAMAHALPVISTRHAGIPEAVLDGVTGLLVEEGDSAGMADCLLSLSGEPDQRTTLGRAAWHRARDRYSWEHERHALLAILGLEPATTGRSVEWVANIEALPGDPLVSVVVPAFNRATTIERCLQSVREQSYPRWETIVVDDGSTDATAAVASVIAQQDSRIRLVRHTTRRGAQAARNSGIRASRGEWIAFLDSDDELLPHSVESRLRRGLRERREVVHSACQVRYEDGALKPYRVPRLSGRIYPNLLRHEGPVFPALLVRRAALERIGYLDERIIAFQEWDTAIRLACEFEFGFEPEPTFIYNCDGADAMSKDLLRNGHAYEQVVGKHFAAMLLHGGPAAMAEHCRKAERWYRLAGASRPAARCRMVARLWSCFDPTAVWGKMRASLIRPA
jgi:glycosyltransferase involved in cell wall biosynthesis